MSTLLTNEELKIVRNIRIHRILNIMDNGRRVSIRCPYHGERTPSFTLYPDNSFYCFGCGANGNGSIDFLMKMGASFSESLLALTKYL